MLGHAALPLAKVYSTLADVIHSKTADSGGLSYGRYSNPRVDQLSGSSSSSPPSVWRVVCFAPGHDVDTVVVDGNARMQGRQPSHVDVHEVLAEAGAETQAMLGRTGFTPLLYEPATLWGRSRH